MTRSNKLVGIVVAALLVAPTAQAQSLSELRPDFMQGCQEQGNDAPACACIYDNWSADLREDQTPLAATAIEMFLGQMPQDASQMAAASTLIQGMTSVLLACASGELSMESETLPPIPQTGDAVEEQLLYERVTTAGGTAEEMSRYAALVEVRRAQERAAEVAVQAATEERAIINTAQLREDYEAELAHIHSRNIDDWDLAEFENLFTLYCQSGGGTAESCACAWPILTDVSSYNGAAYMASRNEGDDITDRLSAADISSSFFTLRLFNEQRAVCDTQ